ncbi:hypothetical protein WN55_05456 [Dufourea novaeangliae]|uniref:Uncharacterized protein n=1 Tax=Dufourea novaeangliae TaxID=178035 RepID=A0A154P0H5_DUFNO|nr:hypothetical protein WN55_05456 [Dufourea novaeangliae]
MWNNMEPESPEIVIEDSGSGESGEGMEVVEGSVRGEEPGERSGTSQRKKEGDGGEKGGSRKRTLALKLEDREITRDAGNYIFDAFFKRSLKVRRKFSLLRWGVKGGGVLFTTKCEKTLKLMEEDVEKGVKWRGWTRGTR